MARRRATRSAMGGCVEKSVAKPLPGQVFPFDHNDGAGFWWAWFDRDRLTWHDRMSGTRMVREPKRVSNT